MTERINKYSLVIILASVLVLVSCNSNVMYTDTRMMNEKIWDLPDIQEFDVPVSDTINTNNVFITIRTGSEYPFRNIYLFVTTSSPDGKSITDTLQYFLADEKGKWFGKGFGDIHELKLPYKTNVFFSQDGTYHFKIQHGMRIESITGVYDVGLRIEKVKNKTRSGEK